MLTAGLIMGLAGPAGPAAGRADRDLAGRWARIQGDPAYRAIVPLTVRSFTPAWLQRLARRPEAAFVLPSTRSVAPRVSVRPAGRSGAAWVDLELRPTAPGDPLILENGGRVPLGRQGVLSAAAAASLKVKAGDRIKVRVVRYEGGVARSAEVRLEVAAVLQARVGRRARLYVPLDLYLAADEYRDGFGVPALGWPGRRTLAAPRYDGLIVRWRRWPGRRRLRDPSGTGEHWPRRRLRRKGQAAALGLVPWTWGIVFQYQSGRGRVFPATVRSTARRLGRRTLVVPWVSPQAVTVCWFDRCRKSRVFGFTPRRPPRARRSSRRRPPVPWGPSPPGQDHRGLLQAMVPPMFAGLRPGETLFLKLQGASGRELIVPVQVAGVRRGLPGLIVPVRLAGLLRTASLTTVRFDLGRRMFLAADHVFTAFRLYARTLDDVEPLVKYLRSQGIQVRSHLTAIGRARAWQSPLARLMWRLRAARRLETDRAALRITAGPGQSFPREWFDRMRRRPEVAFVIPRFRRIVTQGLVRLKTTPDPARVVRQIVTRATGNFFKFAPPGPWPQTGWLPVRIVPTAPGDPAFSASGLAAPSGRQAVLTRAAARSIKARTGDRLILRVSRRAGGRIEFGEFGLTVAGVLRRPGRSGIYVPFWLAEAVADYKDGFEVARLGWPGRARAAFPRFDGFVLWFDQPPEAARLEALTTGTGVTRWRAVAPDHRADVIGFTASSEALVYLLLARRRPVGFDSFQAVRRRAGDMMIVPWVRPMTVLVTTPAWPLPSLPQMTRVFGLSAARYYFKIQGLPFVPPWGPPRENTPHSSLLRALAPAFWPGLKVGDRLQVTILGLKGGPLTCPVQVVGVRPELKGLIVPATLMGLWRTARLRPVRFDAKGRRFLLARRAYAGFRMYARDLSDLPRLQRLLTGQGLTGLRSRAARLVRLRAALRRAVSHSPYRFFWQVTIGDRVSGDGYHAGPAPPGMKRRFWSNILD